MNVRVLDVSKGKVALTLRGVEQGANAPQPLCNFTPREKLGQPPDAKALEQLSCVSLTYSRSGGAGGQNVNKLSTKCEARLSVPRSPWPEAVKARLLSRSSVNGRTGDVIVTSDRHRTQVANRQDALEKLAAIVSDAWFPPKLRQDRGNAPSFKGKAARKQQKQRTSEKKRSRAASKRGIFDSSRRSVMALALSAAAASTSLACLTPAASPLRGPAFARAASALTKEDVSITNLLPEDRTLYVYDPAPLRTLPLPCLNVPGSSTCSLSDLAQGGTKYVVLWFFPEDNGALNLEAANNAKEAINFQRRLDEFAELDCVVVGISGLSGAELQRKLVDPSLLTIPFLSDASKRLIDAFGARNPVGETYRQTFVIDRSGTIRFLERNIERNVGNFNLDNHASRVARELYQIRNKDGWEV